MSQVQVGEEIHRAKKNDAGEGVLRKGKKRKAWDALLDEEESIISITL